MDIVEVDCNVVAWMIGFGGHVDSGVVVSVNYWCDG